MTIVFIEEGISSQEEMNATLSTKVGRSDPDSPNNQLLQRLKQMPVCSFIVCDYPKGKKFAAPYVAAEMMGFKIKYKTIDAKKNRIKIYKTEILPTNQFSLDSFITS